MFEGEAALVVASEGRGYLKVSLEEGRKKGGRRRRVDEPSVEVEVADCLVDVAVEEAKVDELVMFAIGHSVIRSGGVERLK